MPSSCVSSSRPHVLEQHAEHREAHRLDDDGVDAAVEERGALRGRCAPRGDGDDERRETAALAARGWQMGMAVGSLE